MDDLSTDGQTQPAPSRSGRFTMNPWLQVLLLVIAMAVAAAILWAIFGSVQHSIILFGVSLLLAFLLGSLVDRLEKRMPRWLAIVVSYLLLIAVGFLLLWILLSPFLSQMNEAASSDTSTQSTTFTGLASFLSQFGITVDAQAMQQQFHQFLQDHASDILAFLAGIAGNIAGFIADLLFVIALSAFMLIDGRSLNNRILRLIPDAPRESALFFQATLSKAVGAYARGQIVVATIIGLLSFAICWVLGVNYAAVIGVAGFVFEFIPLLGPVIVMLLAMLVASFQPWPLVLWVFIAFVILQQLESNLIEPKIAGGAVGLHPLVVLVVVLVGVELGGLMGALVAVPIAGMLTVIAMALYLDLRGHTHLLIPDRHAPPRAPVVIEPPPALTVSAGAGASKSRPSSIMRLWRRSHPEGEERPDRRSIELMADAPPAALMFMDQLRIVLNEKDRFRSTFEMYAAKQSAVERVAQGLPESERVAVERSDLELPDIPS